MSLLVHASVGYTMLPALEKVNSEALDVGHGTDIVLVEQGIATEGLAKLGNDMETIETAEVIPVEQPPPPPPQEIKPDELRDVIASDASTIEQEVVKTEEPPPLEPPPPAPQVVQVKEQPEQVAVLTQQSSGDEKTGGDAKAFGLYLGQINEHVQKAKGTGRRERWTWRAFVDTAAWVGAHAGSLEPLVEAHVDLDRAPDTFRALARGELTASKVLVHPQERP